MGGYHQTGVFLSRLANLNRIVNVSNLCIKGVSDQEDSPYSLETSLTLTAYTLGVGGAGVPAEGQGQQLVSSGDGQQPSNASQ